MFDDVVSKINNLMGSVWENRNLEDLIVFSEDSEDFELGNCLKEVASELTEMYIDVFKEDEDPKENVIFVINRVLRMMADKFLDSMLETVEKEL